MKPSRAFLLVYNVFCAAVLGLIGVSSLSLLNS
jgi:hypothetical protein